jgi:hypothetical protein
MVRDRERLALKMNLTSAKLGMSLPVFNSPRKNDYRNVQPHLFSVSKIILLNSIQFNFKKKPSPREQKAKNNLIEIHSCRVEPIRDITLVCSSSSSAAMRP